MRRIHLSLILLPILLLNQGCLTTGRNFPSQTEWIDKERTSQNDVKFLLGEPFSIGNSGGVPTWTYAFYKYEVLGKSRYKELKFYWKPDGKVQHFAFSSSFPDDIKTLNLSKLSKKLEQKPTEKKN